MKKISLVGLLLSLYISSTAQHTEFSAGLNTGLMSFRGHSAVNSSFVYQGDLVAGGYTNKMYSKKAGVGVGVDFALQRISKKRFIYGIATGIEFLKQNMPVTSVSNISGDHPATGTIHMHSHFINFRPMAGYRFDLDKKISLDLAASVDIAFGLGSLYEVGVATTNSGDRVRVENDRDKLITDFRPGLQLKLNVNRLSLMTGYWIGEKNYYKGYAGGNPEAYSKLFRLGVSYRWNKIK